MSTRLALYVKGKILTFDEHYAVTLDVIKRKFSKHRGIVIDIGAFSADSAVYLAKRLGKNKILAFEPNPTPFEKGRENIKGYSNIQMFNLGFSSSAGEVDFFVTKDLVSSSLFDIKDFKEISAESVIKVNVNTLDNFFHNYEKILLIKLDVQGAELDILKAGAETLKKTQLILTEMLVVEMYHNSCLYYEVDELLRKNNFRIHTIVTNYNKDGIKYFDILYINISSV